MVDTNSKDMVDTFLMEEVRYALDRCYRERGTKWAQEWSPRGVSVITDSGISVNRVCPFSFFFTCSYPWNAVKCNWYLWGKYT